MKYIIHNVRFYQVCQDEHVVKRKKYAKLFVDTQNTYMDAFEGPRQGNFYLLTEYLWTND